jgi:hypothetical protein
VAAAPSLRRRKEADSFYGESLLNPHWGESVAFGKDNSLDVTMAFQGVDQQQAQSRLAAFQRLDHRVIKRFHYQCAVRGPRRACARILECRVRKKEPARSGVRPLPTLRDVRTISSPRRSSVAAPRPWPVWIGLRRSDRALPIVLFDTGVAIIPIQNRILELTAESKGHFGRAFSARTANNSGLCVLRGQRGLQLVSCSRLSETGYPTTVASGTS